MFPEAAVGKTKRLAEFKLLENDNCGERFASSAQRKITIVAQLDSTPKKSEFRWISKNDVCVKDSALKRCMLEHIAYYPN